MTTKFVTVGIFVTALAITLVSGCMDLAGGCDTEISQRVFSPDSTLQAVSLTTDCGATTATSYGVRIIEGTDLTEEGKP